MYYLSISFFALLYKLCYQMKKLYIRVIYQFSLQYARENIVYWFKNIVYWKVKFNLINTFRVTQMSMVAEKCKIWEEEKERQDLN